MIQSIDWKLVATLTVLALQAINSWYHVQNRNTILELEKTILQLKLYVLETFITKRDFHLYVSPFVKRIPENEQ